MLCQNEMTMRSTVIFFLKRKCALAMLLVPLKGLALLFSQLLVGFWLFCAQGKYVCVATEAYSEPKLLSLFLVYGIVTNLTVRKIILSNWKNGCQKTMPFYFIANAEWLL